MFHQFSQLNTNYFSSATRRGLHRLYFDKINPPPEKIDCVKLENSHSKMPCGDVENENEPLFSIPSSLTPSPSLNYSPNIQKNQSPKFSADSKSSFTPIKLSSFYPISRTVLV
jgi:hypothetical protein